jgi:hypothetical protein
MRKNVMTSVAMGAVLLGVIGQALSNGKNDHNGETSISVSPQCLLLAAEQSGRVTVHTNIPMAEQESVTLNGVPAIRVYEDDLGHLAAKFLEEEIKQIVTPPRHVLTLNIDGDDVGSDIVRVVD